MKYLIILIACLVVSLLRSGNSNAQKTCPFPINNQRILTNQNLDTFLHLFKTDSFVERNKKKHIPRFIKKELKCLANDKFRIANPGKPYNEGDIISGNLPMRQLVFLARSKDVFVMQYKKGGFASSNNLVCVIHNGKQILDLWKGTISNDEEYKSVKEIAENIEYTRKINIELFKPSIYF